MESGFYLDKQAMGSHFDLLTTDAIAAMDLQFKIVIVGDSGCGKTSLFNSYIRGSFPREYEPTIFENHRSFVQSRTTGDILSADLWDTAGQEEYERLRRLSYQDADLVIIAYNMNSQDSLANIPEVWALESLQYAPGSLVLLVGLKSDMHWEVNPLDAERVAREIGAIGHIKCSSMMNDNVDGVFDAVFNSVYNRAKIVSGQAQLNASAGAASAAAVGSSKKKSSALKQQKNAKKSAAKQQKRKSSSKCVILWLSLASRALF